MEDPKKFLGMMLMVLAGMFIIWIFTGGPARYETANPLVGQPAYTSTNVEVPAE